MKALILASLSALLFLIGCTSSQQPPAAQKNQGRTETRKLEAATAVGYDGAAIRKNVDNTLNKNDDRTREVDKQGADTK